MARIEKTVFISYRRTDVYTALAVYENLKNQGYDIFFDYRSIPSGDFEQIITANIRARAHFLLILTPTALDRCNEPGDWLRREIELAIDEKRNLVPLFFKGFRFGVSSVTEKLIGKLKNLSRYNGLNVHEDYFEEAMHRVREQFLSRPLDTVLHPVSTDVQKVVEEEMFAADEALKQRGNKEQLVRQSEAKLDTSKEITGNDQIQNGTSVQLEKLIARRYHEYKMKGYTDGFLGRGLNWAVEKTNDVIREIAVPVRENYELADVAANSVSDWEIGQLVADVLDRVGAYGLITVEESKSPMFEIEFIEGMRFYSGYLSPDFVTEVEWQEAVVIEPYILIYDGKISDMRVFTSLIERLEKNGTGELFIVAEDFSEDVIDTLSSNKMQGIPNILAVKAPEFGQYKRALLRDIAILTGGNVISGKKGDKLETATLQDFGRAEKIISDKESTTIVGGKGKRSDINKRIGEINIELGRSVSDDDRLLLRKRLSKLVGGEAIIRVGASIKAEAKAKKRRVQTALSAALAAITGGVVPGNGVSYLICKDKLAGFNTNYDYERVGQFILCDVLDAPISKIASSLDLDPATVIDQIIKKRRGKRNVYGLDIKTGEFVDLVKKGVIEPADNVIHTISHAVDAAIGRAISMENK